MALSAVKDTKTQDNAPYHKTKHRLSAVLTAREQNVKTQNTENQYLTKQNSRNSPQTTIKATSKVKRFVR